jgi:uncharacterized lipoprotein YajG
MSAHGLVAIIVLTLMGVLVAGCSTPETTGNVTRSGTINFQEVCLNGVIYYYAKVPHRGYLAVKYNRDGTVATCEG